MSALIVIFWKMLISVVSRGKRVSSVLLQNEREKSHSRRELEEIVVSKRQQVCVVQLAAADDLCERRGRNRRWGGSG
jgi:tRNA uridine 5-carbamoylmethylation protein Kti12